MVVGVCLKVIRDFDSSSLHVDMPVSACWLRVRRTDWVVRTKPSLSAQPFSAWHGSFLSSPAVYELGLRVWLATHVCIHHVMIQDWVSVLTNDTRDFLAYIADSASPLVDTSAATGCESDQNDVADHECRAEPIVVLFTFLCRVRCACLSISQNFPSDIQYFVADWRWFLLILSWFPYDFSWFLLENI